MKKISKLFSVILSLAIIMQCVLSLCGIGVSAEDGNLLRNPGFENGPETEAFDWGIWPGWDGADFISTDVVNSGSRALKFELGEQSYALFAGGYRPEQYDTSASVIVSAWVKYENLVGGVYFNMERKAADQNVAGYTSPAITGTSAGWEKITFEIPSTKLYIDECVVKFEIASGSGTLYIDDISMIINPVQNILQNNSFENGDRDNNWGCYGADTFITTATADVRTGFKALKFVQGGSEYAVWSDTYNSDTTTPSAAMTYSIWAKYENLTGDGFRIIAESDGGEGYVTDSYTGSSNGWKLITFDTPIDSGRTGVRFKISVYAGSGTVCFDDASISVAEKQNYIKNSGFESGRNNFGFYNDQYLDYISAESYRGNRALKVVLSDERNYSVWSDGYNNFDVTKSFTASVMLKYKNVTSGEVYMHVNRGEGSQVNSQKYYFSGSSNGWSEYSFTIPADSAATLAQLQIEFSSGSGTVWVDDFILTDVKGLVNFAENSNTSFESNSSENNVVTAREWGVYPEWCENAMVSSEYSHSGGKAVKITLNETQNYAMWAHVDYSSFNPEQALVVSAWIMVPTETPVTGILYLGAERTNYDLIGQSLENYTTDGQWVRITRVLPKNDVEAARFVLKAEASQGTGTIYLDDFEVYPMPQVSLSQNTPSVTLTSDTVRIGDPIAISCEDVVDKVKHIYKDGIKISEADGSAQAVFSLDKAVFTVSYDDPILGDINDDGTVNVSDLVRLKKYFAYEGQIKIAAVNANIDASQGDINTDDIIGLRKILLTK